MRHLSPKRLLLKAFSVLCAFILFCSGEEAPGFSRTPATLNLTLPQISQDVFVSTRTKDWDLVVSGNHFTLQAPIVRADFSRPDADTIDKVIAVFEPAGAVLSQTSRICNVSGLWMLRVEGVCSRGTTDGIALHSIEVIYRNDSAELVPLEAMLSLDAMNIPSGTDNSGGCNGWFGIAALVPVGIFISMQLRTKTAVNDTDR